ncbi:AurF N-oxygenase family protein [Phaeacidiphilus oryzae]|uniref:AurF N-oxygenase family protein n=1 Tax=Phaeacidiphilus oryzae TaxID=348818 RepID=UPI00056ACAFB|nr:diiron oxygenase [Phaeacidiphilus oryzae]
MSTTAGTEEISRGLLGSSAALSYDPETEVDWSAPLPADKHGLNPEWSVLYGTPLWREMTEEQRVTLTRHEVCSIMSTGIWFEMILQQLILRDQYVKDHASAEFRFALTEIADECRHSLMFARACEAMGVPAYFPRRPVVEAARLFKAVGTAEAAYGGILVAEEVLDVMQRDAMRDERVLDLVRTTSRIHVVEESRHMRFARAEIRDRVAGTGRLRRQAAAMSIAVVAYVIVTSLVNDGVFAAAGLDPARAREEARRNPHHHAMMRSSGAPLMRFLGGAGLLTRPASALYQRVHLL